MPAASALKRSLREPSRKTGNERTGRPRNDSITTPTKDRLLAAAAAVFAERGFEQATVAEIARQADISGPAVYKHFADKADLLLAAARWRLEGLAVGQPEGGSDTASMVAEWLAPAFAPTRMLLLELHLLAGRHDEVAEMLAQWHQERSAHWLQSTDLTVSQIKAYYLLLLGLAQVDALPSLAADHDELVGHAVRMAETLLTS